MRTRLRRATALAATTTITLLALTACNSDADKPDRAKSTASTPAKETSPQTTPSQTASEDAGKSPCMLITAGELQSILGGTFQPAGESDGVVGSDQERHCGYSGPNDRTVMIETQVDDTPGGTVWQAIVKAEENPIGGGSSTMIPLKIGDDAFIGSTATVSVRVGTSVTQINFLGEETTDDTAAALQELALIASHRM